MRNRQFATVSACILAAAALQAQPSVSQPVAPVMLASDVFVERVDSATRVLEPAQRLRPGDRVVTIVSWKRAQPGRHFTVTNPLPRTLYFQGTADGDEEVSVDGGRTWGRLGSLRIAERLATPEDVTHVRWRIATPAPQGRIAYSAIVR